MAKHSKKHGNYYGSVQSHKIEDYDGGMSDTASNYTAASSSVRRYGPRGSGHLGAGGHVKAGHHVRNRVGRGRRGR